MVEEARAFARAEVESAHSTVLRVEAALEEQAQTLKIAEKEVSDIRLSSILESIRETVWVAIVTFKVDISFLLVLKSLQQIVDVDCALCAIAEAL